jgi:hypothetical protein
MRNSIARTDVAFDLYHTIRFRWGSSIGILACAKTGLDLIDLP